MYPLRKMKLKFKDLHEIIENTVDESDPDFDSGSQVFHNLYTAEACRILFPDEDWMHLVGFLHDYGKILMNPDVYDFPSWATVGDIFPVGCQFSEKIVYYDYLKNNADFNHEVYSTKYGIYEPNCGFENLHMSFSHDEYMYQILKANQRGKEKFPEEGLYVIRFHSFYPWHLEGEYSHLANEKDKELRSRLQKFSSADLYTKMRSCEKDDLLKLLPYYDSLIEKYVCPLDEEIQI